MTTKKDSWSLKGKQTAEPCLPWNGWLQRTDGSLRAQHFRAWEKQQDIRKHSRHVAAMALPFVCLPIELNADQVRGVRLRDLDFDRQMLHMDQSREAKIVLCPVRAPETGLKKYIGAENPTDYLLGGQHDERSRDDFESRYSRKGFNGRWKRPPSEPAYAPLTFATQLLEDGTDMNYIQKLLVHKDINH